MTCLEKYDSLFCDSFEPILKEWLNILGNVLICFHGVFKLDE